MGRRDAYRAELTELVERPHELEQLVVRKSALPDRRANPKLALEKIVASNLRKARLARPFPERVEEVGEVLMDGSY